MRKMNERKLRHSAKIKLRAVVKGDEDAFIYPITSPYTD
jgi:predicted nucleotidyltransferase